MKGRPPPAVDPVTEENSVLASTFPSESAAYNAVLAAFSSRMVAFHAVHEGGVYCVWTVLKTHGKKARKEICAFLVCRFTESSLYSVRSLPESMGPYFYSCPLHLLQDCSSPSNNLAVTWRNTLARVSAP